MSPEPTPTTSGVDWPALVAACERRRIPVARVDRGDIYLIRTVRQLREEWVD